MKIRWTVMALALGLAAPAGWSRDVPYDFVVCNHARLNMLEANAEVVAFGVEQWGVVASSTTKEWENATSRCVGAIRVSAGKRVGKGTCKWFNMAGDTAVVEWEWPEGGEPASKWLAGTGALKGIGGGGSFKQFENGKPTEPGTAHDCRRDWGKYTLP